MKESEGRPRVVVNCAMSPDGKIATIERKQVRISSEEDMQRVKQLRKRCDAILAGVGTVLADDPHLTVKDRPKEEQALRIVLDPHGRVPPTARILDERASTLVVTLDGTAGSWPRAEVLRAGTGTLDLMVLMKALERRGVRTLLVEGGGETIFSFFKAGLVDEFLVYVGDRILGGRRAPTPVDGDGFSVEDAVRLRLMSVDRLGEGVLLSYEVLPRS